MSKRKDFLKTDFKIDGFKELQEFLGVLPGRAMKRALKKAVAAGARPIKSDAKRLAPKLSGTLRRAIRTVVRSYPNGNAVAIVGADRSVTSPNKFRKTGVNVPANYIHLVEKGVTPHAQPKNKFFWKKGHPGFTARNFLDRAVMQNESNSRELMEYAMHDAIIDEAAKLKSKKT